MKPRSLSSNLLLAASIVLTAFFVIIAVILEQGFRTSAEYGLKEKLQIQVHTLLSVAELSPTGELTMHSNLHETRFSKPGSGLYAFIHDQQGELVWRTQSTIGLDVPMPTKIKPGQTYFLINGAGQYVLNYAVIWETESDQEYQFVFSVAEEGQSVINQVRNFRNFLWSWLAAIGLISIIIQFFVLRFSLKPLRVIVSDLGDIESGTKDRLDGNYPNELQGLAGNLNALISSERAHLERYRNTLTDLAHSLKTPLAIMRGLMITPELKQDTRMTLQTQVSRMDEIVEYQLKKAAAKGQKKLIRSIHARSVLQKIVGALTKVYTDKAIDFEIVCDDQTRIYCEQGDLYEIAANLIDNAGKWCQKKIRITLYASKLQTVVLIVEDDGYGIPEQKLDSILKRGIRADENTQGHGIGMAIVNELVTLLGGQLQGQQSTVLGGMKWVVRF